jgi:hypothetical protein
MTGAPPALARVIERMLEKAPAARYQSATDARDALEAALGGRIATPAAGVPVFSADTTPSIGPFPKTTDELMHSATVPPTSRRTPTAAEMERLISSATLPAGAAASVREPARVPAKKKWLVPAIATGALAIGAGAFAIVGSGSSKPAAAPPSPPVTRPAPPLAPPLPPQPEPAKPAEPPPPVEVVPKPADPTTKPADVSTKHSKHATKPKPPTTKPAGDPVTRPAEPPPAGSNKPALPF